MRACWPAKNFRTTISPTPTPRWNASRRFEKTPACVIVKHANPCGVALGTIFADAYEQAFATDPVSAFGGIIAFNHPLDEETARAIMEKQFVEVVIAPEIDAAALAALSAKPNVRVLACGMWEEHARTRSTTSASPAVC